MAGFSSQAGVFRLNSPRAVQQVCLDEAVRSDLPTGAMTGDPQLVQLRHVDRMLEEECDLPVRSDERRMRRAPEVLLEPRPVR